jgi:hypothetical protein
MGARVLMFGQLGIFQQALSAALKTSARAIVAYAGREARRPFGVLTGA